MIANNEPDAILITEVIPNKQGNPNTQPLLDIYEYNCLPNFDPDKRSLSASGIRGVAIYSKTSLKVGDGDLYHDDFEDPVIRLGTGCGARGRRRNLAARVCRLCDERRLVRQPRQYLQHPQALFYYQAPPTNL